MNNSPNEGYPKWGFTYVLYKNENSSFEMLTKDLLIIDKTFMAEAAILQQWIDGFRSKDINVLERVQKRATKLIKGFGKLSYDQRLKSLHLFCCREWGDLIEAQVITTSILLPSLCQPLPPTLEAIAWSCLNLILDYLFNPIFLHKEYLINSWNSLTDEIISSNTVGQFKAKLDKAGLAMDLNIGSQPNTKLCLWIIVYPLK